MRIVFGTIVLVLAAVSAVHGAAQPLTLGANDASRSREHIEQRAEGKAVVDAKGNKGKAAEEADETKAATEAGPDRSFDPKRKMNTRRVVEEAAATEAVTRKDDEEAAEAVASARWEEEEATVPESVARKDEEKAAEAVEAARRREGEATRDAEEMKADPEAGSDRSFNPELGPKAAEHNKGLPGRRLLDSGGTNTPQGSLVCVDHVSSVAGTPAVQQVCRCAIQPQHE